MEARQIKVSGIKKRTMKKFDKYLIDVARRASDMKDEMISLRKNKDAIRDFEKSQLHSRLYLKLALEDLRLSINNTLQVLN